MMSEVDIQGRQAPEFTRREREVLQLLVEGHSNNEISLALKIARRTVEFHIGNILSKLEVNSRSQAITKTLQGGWLDGDKRLR